LENWNNDGLDNSTRTRNLKPALRPAQHDAICRVLKIGLLSVHQRKIECQQKNIGLLHLNTATTFTRKETEKKGNRIQEQGTGLKKKLGANDKNRCDQACLNT